MTMAARHVHSHEVAQLSKVSIWQAPSEHFYCACTGTSGRPTTPPLVGAYHGCDVEAYCALALVSNVMPYV